MSFSGLARRIARALSLDEPAAAIVPLVVGESDAAVALSSKLLARGLDVRAVRPPTVSEGSARLRIACRLDLGYIWLADHGHHITRDAAFDTFNAFRAQTLCQGG